MTRNTKNIPEPSMFVSWKEWGQALSMHLGQQARSRSRVLPQTVMLEHRNMNGFQEKATENGILMWDESLKKVVVSVDGAWVPIH